MRHWWCTYIKTVKAGLFGCLLALSANIGHGRHRFNCLRCVHVLIQSHFLDFSISFFISTTSRQKPNNNSHLIDNYKANLVQIVFLIFFKLTQKSLDDLDPVSSRPIITRPTVLKPYVLNYINIEPVCVWGYFISIYKLSLAVTKLGLS